MARKRDRRVYVTVYDPDKKERSQTCTVRGFKPSSAIEAIKDAFEQIEHRRKSTSAAN